MDVGRVPVVRIFFNDQGVVGTIVLDLKRPTGNNMLLPDPILAPFIDRLFWYEAEKLVCQQTDEKRSRLLESYPKRIFVNRLDADVLSLYRYKLGAGDGRFQFRIGVDLLSPFFFIAIKCEPRRQV